MVSAAARLKLRASASSSAVCRAGRPARGRGAALGTGARAAARAGWDVRCRSLGWLDASSSNRDAVRRKTRRRRRRRRRKGRGAAGAASAFAFDPLHLADAASSASDSGGGLFAAPSAASVALTGLALASRKTKGKGKSLLGMTISKWPKLGVSILIDLAGIASFLFPGLGELTDLLEAPAAAVIMQKLYGSSVFTSVILIEELLPFTDFIPTATIAWLLEFTPLDRVLPFLPLLGKKREDWEKANAAGGGRAKGD